MFWGTIIHPTYAEQEKQTKQPKKLKTKTKLSTENLYETIPKCLHYLVELWVIGVPLLASPCFPNFPIFHGLLFSKY